VNTKTIALRLKLLPAAPPDGPHWSLVGMPYEDPATAEAEISVLELEAGVLDRRVVRRQTALLMEELEAFSARGARTPGGAWWLHVHHIPVRRLLGQLVRKLLLLNGWTPFAQAPGPIQPAAREGLVGVRDGSAREYRHYTVTWSGVAYALGASAPGNPDHSARLRREAPSVEQPPSGTGTVQPIGSAEVLAMSWSSRHAETLLPVLTELADRGFQSVLLDLATEPTQYAVPPRCPCVRIVRAPGSLLCTPGTVPGLTRTDAESGQANHTVRVAGRLVELRRLEHLVAAMLELGAGCTQPSWQATIGVETWIQTHLAAVQPLAVLVSNDISPLGALAVHTAERFGAVTVNVQHGAWTADAVSRPALYARHQVVMGERDADLARIWVKHPRAEVHALGQPRFDTLVTLSRTAQRRYLLKLLNAGARCDVQRVVVVACQPFGPLRLAQQFSLLVEGLQAAKERWGLVLAPHPAQDPNVLTALVEPENLPVAVADPRVGARGCLAGADAVASVSSTCGLEAVLLDVPVLELAAPGESTLGLAEQGAAYACTTAQHITAALDTLTGPTAGIAAQAKDAVCRWRGTSARDIADLIISCSTTGSALAEPPDHPDRGGLLGASEEEGAVIR
jgi:hypothetical protein